MKILYTADERQDAQLAANAIRAVAPAASITWAARLSDAAAWLLTNKDLDVVVVDARVQNQCSAPFVRHIRSLGLTTPILVVVPETVPLPIAMIEAGADEFVPKNQSLLPRVTAIVSRAIQHDHAERRLRDLAAENQRLRESETRAQKLDGRLAAALTLLQQRDADVESAVQRLRQRDTQLADASQARDVLEQRRIELQAALQDLHQRSADEQVAATHLAAEQQLKLQAVLAERLAESNLLNRELAEAHERLSRSERDLETVRQRLADSESAWSAHREAEERHACELREDAARVCERLEHREAQLVEAVANGKALADRLADVTTALHRAETELRKSIEEQAAGMASAEATIAEQRAEFEQQLARASAAHTALEQSITDLERQHEAAETAAAAQLARQQRDNDARLAEADAAHAVTGQRLLELTTLLEISSNERAAEAAAASQRVTELERESAERESEYRNASDRQLVELNAAATAHAALEQRIATLQVQHASSMEALAAQLEAQQRENDARLAEQTRLERESAERESAYRDASDRHCVELNAAASAHAALEERMASMHAEHASSIEALASQLEAQQRESDAQLADQTAAREDVERQLRDAVAASERAGREHESNAAAATERLTRRETELAASSAARLALEQRLIDVEIALDRAREIAVAERAAAVKQAAKHQAEFDAQLATEAEARMAVERELAQARMAAERELADARLAAEHQLADARIAAEHQLADARLAADNQLADARIAAEHEIAEVRTMGRDELQKLSNVLDAVRSDTARTIERLTAEHAAELTRFEGVIAERNAELQDQAAHHLTAQHASQQAFSTLEGEHRAALAAHSQQVDELNGELQALTEELAATKNHRDALQLEAHRAPELAKQLAASRAQSRRQFEQSPVSMLRCSLDGALQDANHALVAALGYRSIDELRAVDFQASVLETANGVSSLVQRCQNGARQSGECVLKKKDGGRLSMRLHVTQVSAEAIEIVAEDLTNLRAVEERLHQAHRMEAVGRVAAEIADTCDALLRNVSRSGHQLLASLGAATPQHHQGEAIFADVTRAAGFLRQLSAYGHKQARASLPVDVVQVLRDLEPVLKQVAGDDIELILPKKNSALNVDVNVERVQRILVHVAAYGRARMPAGGRLIVELARVAVDHRFTTKYPNVREGGHALVRITEVKAARATWPIALNGVLPSHAGGPMTERPGVDLGALQGLIGDCGGHLWLNAEPGGNLEVKVRLPLRAPERTAHIGGSIGSRAVARLFRN